MATKQWTSYIQKSEEISSTSRMADPLAQIVGLLQPGAPFSKCVTGSGPWEDSRHTYAFASVLAGKGIRHYVDDWGWKGGHDWPYWKEMIREYVGRW